MRTEVVCEQVILGWSPSNLLGVSGIGPVAASPGWELSSTDKFVGLGDAARYLPQDAAATVPAGSVLPTCLEYRPIPSGALFLAKVHSTTSRRPGQYQVHAIRATEGLSSWDLWRFAEDEILVQDELTDHATTLDRLRVTATDPPPLVTDSADLEPLARLLECLTEGWPYFVSDSNQSRGITAIQALLSYLPLGLVRDVAVSSFVPSQQTWRSGVGLLVPPHSQGNDEPDLTLVPYTYSPASSAYLALAEQFIDPVVGQRVPQLSCLGDLHSWMALERTDLMSIPIAVIHQATTAPFFNALLVRVAAHPNCVDLLMRILADTPTEEAFAARLRTNGPENADVVAVLLRIVGRPGSRQGAALQTWILRSIGSEQFRKYVLPSLALEARATAVSICSPELAQVLGESAAAEDLEPFTFAASPTHWTSVCEAELEAYLRDSQPMTVNSRALLHDSPQLAASYLDNQLRSGAWRQGTLGTAAEQCADDMLPDMIAILVRCDEIPADWPVRILARRAPDLARDVLAEQWPGIAKQLGIPAQIAELLIVRKKSWWSPDRPPTDR